MRREMRRRGEGDLLWDVGDATRGEVEPRDATSYLAATARMLARM